MSDMALSRQEGRRRRFAYLLSAPASVLILLIYVLPIVAVFVISFTDYSLVYDGFSFVGLDNYKQMITDEHFVEALKNTLIYAAIFIPGAFFIPLVLAIAIQRRRRFRSILEVLYFLPVTSTLTAMTLVWRALLDGNQGAINNMLVSLGLEKVNWLGDGDIVLVSIAMVSIWGIIGFNMVLFLAGLTAIPQNLYEAASIDGADHPLDRFFQVTWPLLAPTSLFVSVNTLVTAFKLFDTVAVLTHGGPDRASEVYLYLAYLEGFENFNMAYACALSLVFLAALILVAWTQTRLGDRRRTHA